MIRAGKPFVYDMTLAWTAFLWTWEWPERTVQTPGPERTVQTPAMKALCHWKQHEICKQLCHTPQYFNIFLGEVKRFQSYCKLAIFPTFWIRLGHSSFGELACFAPSRFLQISYLGRARKGDWRFVGNVIVAQQGWEGSEHSSWFLGVLQSMAVASYILSRKMSLRRPHSINLNHFSSVTYILLVIFNRSAFFMRWLERFGIMDEE